VGARGGEAGSREGPLTTLVLLLLLFFCECCCVVMLCCAEAMLLGGGESPAEGEGQKGKAQYTLVNKALDSSGEGRGPLNMYKLLAAVRPHTEGTRGDVDIHTGGK